MKALRKIALGLALACLAPGAAGAQDVIYNWPTFEFESAENTASDGIIRETRKGDQVIEAEIDFCFQRELYGKWDRIVLPLKFDGAKLSGAGTSQFAKTPVTVDLTRKRSKSASLYGGTIKVGELTAKVREEDVPDRVREDITDPQDSTLLIEDPADFTIAQPQTIAVRVKRGALKTVLAALRGENVVLDTNYGLLEDCNTLRSGRQTIVFATPPDNAVALVAKLRKVDGVLAAGWSGYNSLDSAVRVSAGPWTTGGKLDREKLGNDLAKAVPNALDAKFLSSRWETNSGQLILELKRISHRFHDAGFSESVTVRVMVSPERLGSTEFLVVWVMTATANLLDDGPGPRLDIPPFHEVGGEGYIGPEKIVATIAKELRGAVWDSGTEKWVAPQ